MIKDKKLIKHPSFGYATEVQMERLKELGPCAERDLILKAIEKQTRAKKKKK